MADTLAILDKLGLDYKVKGNRAELCCPFHRESNPSFSIFINTGAYKCFSCGATSKTHGGLQGLIKHISGSNYYEFTGETKTTFKFEKAKTSTFKNREFNITHSGDFLDVNTDLNVTRYLASINMTSEFIKTFDVSYFRYMEFKVDDLEPLKMWNRICIPVKNLEGKIVNFECRDFTKKSGKKVLYPRGADTDLLFNFENLDLSKPVYAVEGIKGLANIWRFNRNVISTFSKNIKEKQWKLLNLIPNLILIPDNDKNKIDKNTGEPYDTIQHMIDQFDDNYDREYRIAEILEDGNDPSDLDFDTFKSITNNAKTSTEYLLDQTSIFKKEDYNWY